MGIITSQIECLPAEPYLLARSAYRSLVKRASRVIPGKDQRLSDDDDE